MKIETTEWKEFAIKDFFDIDKPIARSQKNYNEGNIPFIASGNYNNGVLALCEPHKNEAIDKGNCITVSPIDGSTFYQPNDFLGRGGAGSSILILRNDHLNYRRGLFLVTIMRRIFAKYTYIDALNSTIIKEEKLLLPVTDDGSPDWDKMELYIENIEKNALVSLSALIKAKELEAVDSINISTWKDFNISDLFDLSLPNGDLQTKKVIDGDVPLITPSNNNNGLFKFISKENKSTLYKKGSITVDMFGNAYFHDYDFFVTAHGHVNVLIPKKELNRFTALFICSAIKSMFLQKYGFSDMCTQAVLKKAIIKLPANKNGKPDYEYMEQYMNQIEKKVRSSLNKIQSVIC